MSISGFTTEEQLLNQLDIHRTRLKGQLQTMSCGILIKNPDYIILAADKLTTFLFRNGQLDRYDDKCNKIVKVPNTEILVLNLGLSVFKQDYFNEEEQGKTIEDIVLECSGKTVEIIKEEIFDKVKDCCSDTRYTNIIVAGVSEGELKTDGFLCTKRQMIDLLDKRKTIELHGAFWLSRIEMFLKARDTLKENIELADDVLTAAALLDKWHGDIKTIGETHDIFVIEKTGIRYHISPNN